MLQDFSVEPACHFLTTTTGPGLVFVQRDDDVGFRRNSRLSVRILLIEQHATLFPPSAEAPGPIKRSMEATML